MRQQKVDTGLSVGDWIEYRTVGIEVAVEFADRAQTVVTLEGQVACLAGDAIVTGVLGERWPVPESTFNEKYEPTDGQRPGEPGKYRKKIRRSHAAQLSAPADIELSGSRGRLHGNIGDWCVRFGPDNMAIVGKDIFPKSYELESVPVYVALGTDLLPEKRTIAEGALAELRRLISHTCIAVIDECAAARLQLPIWFRVVNTPQSQPHCIPEVIELPIQALNGSSGQTNLLALIAEAKKENVFQYSLRRFGNTFSEQFKKREADAAHYELLAIVAEQLTEVDRFNANLANEMGLGLNDDYYLRRTPDLEPSGLQRIHRIGAVADHLASKYQEKWQRLVMATTNEFAAESNKGALHALIGLAKFLFRQTLVTFGLLAALGLASFSELSGGCNPEDPFAFLGCTSESWKHWFGPLSFFAVYLFALGAAWLKYARAKVEKWEARHQDYRLMAEAVRVLYVRSILDRATCVGCDLPVAEPAASGWVNLALRSIFHAQPMSDVPGNASTRVFAANTCFIEDQLNYHKDKLLKRRESAIELLSGAGRWGFRLFFAVILVLAINVAGEICHHPILSEMGHHFVLIAMVAGLAFWGAMRKVIDSFAWEQEIQRGKLVLDALQRASQTNSPEAVYEAADFFLNDQAAWHALHRARPIEAATGA